MRARSREFLEFMMNIAVILACVSVLLGGSDTRAIEILLLAIFNQLYLLRTSSFEIRRKS